MWRSPVRASAPFGLRRGAGANTVDVVVVVALVVVAHFAPRPPSACNWRCHLLPPLLHNLIINSHFGSKLLAALHKLYTLYS